MSAILSIGTHALQANQAALQTAGNNIANVNTAGYSRQGVVLNNVAGQFSGSGYYGKGVEVTTVQRMHSEFLTRQAALSSSVSAADTQRLSQLTQLEDIFQGGANGLGASVSDMLNAFSDVAGTPTDLSARTVVLSSADEMASRFRAASTRMDDLKLGVTGQLTDAVSAVNSLLTNIASANQAIARSQGSGHTPNDLLDQRDQLISNLNQYIQTSSIAASDGSVGIFVAGSQPLVLGTTVSPLRLGGDSFGDPAKTKLTVQRGTTSVTLEEATLGGGKMAGLLRFQNSDLADAEKLLGRMAQAIGTAVNEQHQLGLDLNGNAGGNLFQLSMLPNGLAHSANTGSATLSVAMQTAPPSGSTALAASNYEIQFTSASAGTLTRLSDGQGVAFAASPISIDGLNISVGAGALAGDRFLITPFSDASSGIKASFLSPAALAVASPVVARAGSAAVSNQGTLAVASLAIRSVPAPAPVTLTFTTASTFTRSDTGATSYAYTPGKAIEYAPLSPSTSAWSLTLSGAGVGTSASYAGDTFTIGAATLVQPSADPRLNSGNAEAMMSLRDVAMFDSAALTDGYASVMSAIGTRVQGATTAAQVSTSIATSVEKERSSVAGVNLDEEAANLLQYQQAYQASAKMLQTAQTIFDTLLQTVGR